MHKISFEVPLSGSLFFDLNTSVMARKLCDKFPGLQYEKTKTTIHIFGELNEYWYSEFNKAVFQIGTLD